MKVWNCKGRRASSAPAFALFVALWGFEGFSRVVSGFGFEGFGVSCEGFLRGSGFREIGFSCEIGYQKPRTLRASSPARSRTLGTYRSRVARAQRSGFLASARREQDRASNVVRRRMRCRRITTAGQAEKRARAIRGRAVLPRVLVCEALCARGISRKHLGGSGRLCSMAGQRV